MRETSKHLKGMLGNFPVAFQEQHRKNILERTGMALTATISNTNRAITGKLIFHITSSSTI